MNAPRHLGNRVRVLSQAIRQAIDRKLTDLDLTGQQSFILRYLSERKDEVVYPKDIEKRFNLTHPTVSGLLQRLEGKGFLTCERHSDRKVRRLPEANLGTHSVDRGADDRWDERTRNRYAGAASGHGRAESGCVHEF